MNQQPNMKRGRSGAVAWCAFLLAASFGVLACSSSDATNTENAAARTESIAGGTLDLTDQGVFLLARDAKDSSALCTASLIAPNLLLTARHCVSQGVTEDSVQCGVTKLGAPYPASDFFATNAAQPQNNSPVFKAIDVRVPDQGADTCGYDMALIILASNVPASVSVPLVPRIDRGVLPGEHYKAVGYGLNETGKSTGGRMERLDLTIACQPGSCGEGVGSTEFLGDTGICSGDSGGPALDDAGKIVGVVSRAGADCSMPVYTTVTAWSAFITATATEAAKLGNYTPPFWVTTGSSDPPLAAGTSTGAGGENGAAGASTAPGEDAGVSCNAVSDCKTGLTCYASDGKNGVCTPTCSDTTTCTDGPVCQPLGDVSVCIKSTRAADESSGCSLSVVRAQRSTVGSLLAALGVALVVLRRRRRAQSA